MLTAIKTLLKDTATTQGLNFAFLSFKEVNTDVLNKDLSISTILVNSTIKSDQEKTQGDSYNQHYELNIACVRKREVESKDDDVFDIIAATEPDFLTYLNTISESPVLNSSPGKFQISTLYFGAATPIAGTQTTITLSTFGNCN